MATESYGTIQILTPAPTGAGGQLLLNNDKALEDARGVRKVPHANSGYDPALMSEAGLAKLAASNLLHTPGKGSVNLQAELYETYTNGYDAPDGEYATISGGIANRATADKSTVVGGSDNTASGNFSIAGGAGSQAGGYGSVALGNNSVASSDESVAIGGYGNTVQGSRSCILGGSNNQCMAERGSILGSSYCTQYASHAVILGGIEITTNQGDSYGIAYGKGRGNRSNGRAVQRCVATDSASAATLSLELATLGSTGAALVEVDILHGDYTNSTFTVSHCIVKVLGTDVTVLDTKGDTEPGTFTMINGVHTYQSANPIHALRANVRITVMNLEAGSSYYYYG